MEFRCAVAAALVLAATAIGPAVAAPKSNPPQASLVLQNQDVALCLHNETAWTLTKTNDLETPAQTGDTVTWTVKATRGATSADMLEVNGFVTIYNSGSGPATIGNIVVNLQRLRTDPNGSTPPNWSGSKWVSASANVSDATSGDAATTANIVAAASQENAGWNGAYNSPATYAVSGDKGTFKENVGSGTLEFTDADLNTIWAISPQQTIPANGAVNLLFQAVFNNTVLGIAEGESVRAEVIVTFGNAGTRGSGDASASNIDINGNGSIGTDEANVRSVPSRSTRNVPDLETCNDPVLLTDDEADMEATGTVTWSGFDNGDILDGILVDETAEFTVTVVVDAGETGGEICNTAHLEGEGSDVSVIIGYETVTNPDGTTSQVPIYVDYACCVGVDLSAESCVDVGVTPDQEIEDEDYCTYTQGGYQGGGVPGDLLLDNWATVFGSSLTIGINDGAGPKHHARWTLVTSLRSWLAGGGPSGALTADTTNATSTTGGTLAKQTATLAINIALNASGATDAVYLDLGSLELCNLVAGSSIRDWTVTADEAAALNGLTYNQVLADCNNALGGNGLPDYVDSFGDLNQLATALNEAFDNCIVSSFAKTHLCKH